MGVFVEGSQRFYGAYIKRNVRLRELGFASYADYLASDLWKSIRRRVFQRDNGRCYCCGGIASQAHHTNYKPGTLAGTSISGIRAICGTCHQWIEVDDQGKTTYRMVGQRLRAIQRRRGIVPKGKCHQCLMRMTKRGHTLCGVCKRQKKQDTPKQDRRPAHIPPRRRRVTPPEVTR